MARINIDEYFIEIAKNVALMSEDPSTQVGCVIVNNKNQIISTGYNGFPVNADKKFMSNDRPMRYHLSVHAEMRALISTKQSLENCRVYVTHASCENCIKHLIEAGIREIIYDKLFTNGKFINDEKAEAIVRLMRGTGIIHKNLSGKSFIDDIEENSNLNFSNLK